MRKKKVISYKGGGGLSRKKDYGSKKKPYPMVKPSNFAGKGRSYPIPTRADAVDALRLAGLHGRGDVKAKVYAKYPDLRKGRSKAKAYGGAIEKYKSGGWIAKATASIKRRGTKGKCTPMSKPGCTGRARALAHTFHMLAAARKRKK